MNADEVIEVLRGGTDPCAGCECYREPHGCNRPEGTCDAYDLCNEAAALIESLTAELAESRRRADAAAAILRTIDWVGSGAKGRIEDAIGILTGRGPSDGEVHHDA